MELKEIDYGKVFLKILELIIIKPLTLPFKIYKNSLIALSNSDSIDSEENNLSTDFPLYIWFLSIFNAVIALIYPIGFLSVIYAAFQFNMEFSQVILALLMLYFYPLVLGFFRELLQISLKVLLYLKLISKKS